MRKPFSIRFPHPNSVRALVLVAMLLTLSACYHATIETGLTPSTQTIEDKWADSWIAGLVPPATVETMERCPAGVARVETQQGFLNQVVGFFTLGIYTPMEIVVTCADDRGASLVTTKEDFEVAIVNGASFLIQAPRVIESDLTP